MIDTSDLLMPTERKTRADYINIELPLNLKNRRIVEVKGKKYLIHDMIWRGDDYLTLKHGKETLFVPTFDPIPFDSKQLEKFTDQCEENDRSLIIIRKGDDDNNYIGGVGTNEPLEEYTILVKTYDENLKSILLDYLKDDEMINGYPKTEGLKRLANMIFGRVSYYATVNQCPKASNGYRATVTMEVSSDNRIAVGTADATLENTMSPFNNYLVATAETRAKGRALKDLLGISVLVAEEVKDLENNSNEQAKSDNIKENQYKNGIRTLCSSTGIDPDKALVFVSKEKSEITSTTISDATQDEARILMMTLVKWVEDKTKIPNEVKV